MMQTTPAAAPPAPETTQASQPTAYEGKEQFNGNTLLVEAYAAIWVVLMAWIFILWRQQSTMGARLDDLERALDRAADAAEKKAKKAS